MAFLFHNDARTFFERIGIDGAKTGRKSDSGYFRTYFDAYWLCAQIGIKNVEFDIPKRKEAPEMTRKFVGESSKHTHLIRGIGFYLHCKKRAMTDEEEELLGEMTKFFSNEHMSLSDSGYDLFNGYANGGFNILHERMGDHCTELSTLLLECYDLL
jgi:hypothetical protein